MKYVIVRPKKTAKAVLAEVTDLPLSTWLEILGVEDVAAVLAVPLVAGSTCLLLSELVPLTLVKLDEERELDIYIY
jgi:hypothetical protein